MKTISITWPWEWKTPEQIVTEVRSLGLNSLCIRAFDGGAEFGVNAYSKMRFGGKTNYDVEKAAKAKGLTTPIWGPVYCKYWQSEVFVIKKSQQIYNPPAIFLDYEGKTAEASKGNLGTFLRALGRLPTKVYLQSYRRPSYHRWVQWEKWFSYRDQSSGQYIIDGVGAQLYPIGVHGVANWKDTTKRDVDDYMAILKSVNREDMPWYPTLPTFTGGTYEGQSVPWKPLAEELQGQIDLLTSLLGNRMVNTGVNFWDLGGLTSRKGGLGSVVQSWIRNLDLGNDNESPPQPPVPPASPVSFLSLPDPKKWSMVKDELIREGTLDKSGNLKQ